MKKGNVLMILLVALLIFLTVALLTAIIGKNSQPVAGQWTLSTNPQSGHSTHTPDYVTDDNYLYTSGGKTIYSLGPQGIRWSVTPGDPSEIMLSFDRWNVDGAASDGNQSYVLIVPGSADIVGFQQELIAVSNDGRLLWTRPLGDSNTFPVTDMFRPVQVSGGNVYVYYGNNVTVLDKRGKVLWDLENVSCIPCVDDLGRLYALKGDLTGSLLEAYYPNGTLIWHLDLSALYGIPISYLSQDPFYQNGTLYLWINHGLAALDINGTLKWVKHFDDQSTSPAGGYVPDSYGNIYVNHVNYYIDYSNDYVNESGYYIHNNSSDYINNYLTVVSQNGSEMRAPYDMPYSVLDDGTAYAVNRNTIPGPSINNFTQSSITAYNVISGKLLWNFTLAANVTYTVVLNESNAHYLMMYNPFESAMDVNRLTPEAWYTKENLPYGKIDIIKEQPVVRLYPGKDSLYVNYWAYNYESPPFFGKANITYTGGLFVLDKEGHLLWSKLTDSYITGVSEKNGTVFYATSDGKFSATGANIAAGLVAAVAYLFIRFLGLGTISRARSRIETNENRNRILKLIAEQPGSTLHEISRDTGLNIGTIRYHLLILSINHKITAYNDGTKFVRYFRNSNAYSEDQKLAISLMRRESMRKVLSIMIKNDAMTNQEISIAADMQESAVSKYLRELYTSGIIVKSSVYGEKSVYYVNNRYRQILLDT